MADAGDDSTTPRARAANTRMFVSRPRCANNKQRHMSKERCKNRCWRREVKCSTDPVTLGARYCRNPGGKTGRTQSGVRNLWSDTAHCRNVRSETPINDTASTRQSRLNVSINHVFTTVFAPRLRKLRLDGQDIHEQWFAQRQSCRDPQTAARTVSAVTKGNGLMINVRRHEL